MDLTRGDFLSMDLIYSASLRKRPVDPACGNSHIGNQAGSGTGITKSEVRVFFDWNIIDYHLLRAEGGL